MANWYLFVPYGRDRRREGPFTPRFRDYRPRAGIKQAVNMQ